MGVLKFSCVESPTDFDLPQPSDSAVYSWMMPTTPVRRFLAALLLALGASCQIQPSSVELPSRFENNRIFLVPEVVSGSSIVFFTDTGGGWNAIRKSMAMELGASDLQVGDSVLFPTFSPDTSIPMNTLFNDGGLTVVDDGDLAKFGDGFLGGRWFGGKVWEFDYHNQKMSLLNEYRVSKENRSRVIPLGFQIDERGFRTMHFARMQIEVDRRAIQVLLDTGATATLTDNSALVLGDMSGASVGTSFIIQSVFEDWRNRHPDWKIISNGDMVQGQTYPMIEVPEVTIGGHVVVPVWFAVRPDTAFVDYMSSMMDEPIEGAIGGSGLQYFRLVVDYPNTVALFFVE